MKRIFLGDEPILMPGILIKDAKKYYTASKLCYFWRRSIKMKQEMVSIALCTYNGAKFISMQVDSILTQTHTNIELIIVDDNSTDNTAIILESFAEKDSRIKLFYNEKNLGFNSNFEKAIKLCSGNYIAIADQDDIWEPNKIELLVKHIGNNWLIFSSSQFIDKSGMAIEGQILLDHFHLRGNNFKSLLLSNFVTGHTVLFSKLFLSYLLPIPKLGYYDWWMGFVASYHHKITFLNKKLTRHRIHSSSVTYRDSLNGKLALKKGREKEVCENLLNLISYKGLRKEDRQYIENIYSKYTSNKLSNKFFIGAKIVKHYRLYFPNLKQRNFLSKLNFALKFALKRTS